MPVACYDDLIFGYFDVSDGRLGAQEANGIEGHLKLRACSDEGTANGFHLCVWGGGGGGFTV